MIEIELTPNLAGIPVVSGVYLPEETQVKVRIPFHID